MDAGASGDDSESWLVDDEHMLAILSSSLSPPPRALPLSPPWSPTELFERMPSSPPAPVAMAIISSSLSPPQLAFPLSPPWSPTDLFERMPPSPPAPVGFLRLSSLDDEYMLPLQIGHCPAQTDLAGATLVTTGGISYGGNTEPARDKLKHAKRKWERDHSFFENNRDSCPLLLKERLTLALRHLNDSSVDQHLLIRVWVPVKTEDGYGLTISGQAFRLVHQGFGFVHYRAVSIGQTFSIDSIDARNHGLPGRVSKHKVLEWTHNVQSYNTRGTFALPVFDAHTQSCIAVVEVIILSKRIKYGDEVNKICKALEAVGLRSINLPDLPNVQIYDKDGDFDCLQDSAIFGIEDGNLKDIDAQNSGGRQCESRLDRSSMSPETVGGTDGNYAVSMDTVQHRFPGDLTNAGKSRAKSEVWQHFMKNGARAYCKHCSKDYAADTRKHGTSRLRRHLVDAHNLKVAVEADSHSLQASDMTVAEKEEPMETNSQSSHSRHCESLGYSTPNSTCNTVVSRDVQYKLSGETLNADKSRAKSEVWQHFAKDGALAYCRYCSKVYEADSRKNGTSRLWRHLSGFHRINKRLVS